MRIAMHAHGCPCPALPALTPTSLTHPHPIHPHAMQIRRSLYDMFALYCEEAQTPGQFRTDLRRIITQGGWAVHLLAATAPSLHLFS